MRSLWIGTLAAALSCSALGWSQTLQPDRWIMVREEGKPAVKCRVVSSTKQKDGSTLCQAKTEAGEEITLLEESIPGKPTSMTRIRMLVGGTSGTTTVAQPAIPLEAHPTMPTPTGTTPALKPVPPPTVLPAVVQTKPEVKKPTVKDSPSLFARLFHSNPSESVEVKTTVNPSRPQLPVSTTLSSTKAVEPMLAPVVEKRRFGTGQDNLVVIRDGKEVTPTVMDRLRAQAAMRQATPTAKPIERRSGLPTGMRSIVAVNERAIMGKSAGGAMVRTPTGEMTYVPPEYMHQGPNSIPVSASNAFTLSMPGGRSSMQGGVPMIAMQAPAAYDTGIPEGAANAFTRTSTTRPIPADFGPTAQNPNAFLIDGMGGAYSRPMAMGYDPRMGYAPVGGGYPRTTQMVPMPHPAGQMLAMLRGSIMPSEREQAVAMLSQCNWHAEPEAVAAIVTAAKSDPAPSVRRPEAITSPHFPPNPLLVQGCAR